MIYYFVGDLHLTDVNPKSRIDDYPTSILAKLSSIFDQARKDGVKAIFFLGDVFHKPSGLTIRYLNRVIETFQKSPCPCYTIIGNHDIPYNRVEDVENTSLGILFKSKALLHLDRYDVNDRVAICGYDYGTDISGIEKPDVDTAICLAHSYGEDVSFGDSNKPEYFRWSDLNLNPFDYYILGHDHSYHGPKSIFLNSTLYRMGALSRQTSALSDTKRVPKILKMVVGDVISFSEVEVEHLPAEQCFNAHALNKDLKVDTVDFSSSLEEVLSNLNFSITGSIFDIIDQMDLDKDVLAVLEEYLRSRFIVRKSD